MTADSSRRMLQALSIAGLIGSLILLICGWQTGVLTSPEAMAAFVSAMGKAGVIIFVLFQAVQVVLPILPGNIGCLAGVLMFGPWYGFLYNYIGICIGSMAAFGIARHCGKPILARLFSERLIGKYRRWTDKDSPFERLFTAAIFFPVAPDDFLCWLAGTTEMPFKRFIVIILLSKPINIAIYSLGLQVIWDKVIALVG